MSGDIGWPDLFLVRGCRCIAAELKVNSKLRPEQQAWLLALGGAGVEVFVWKPGDWETIERTLAR